MIKVERNKPEPDCLRKARTGSNGELARARRHFNTGVPRKKPSFNTYGKAEVRTAIEDVFNHKCAYCEFDHGAGGPPDIEHFRPKGRVRDDPDHDGYWWLAMVWENLLYSCLDCNRERKQVTVTAGMSHEEVEKQRQQEKEKRKSGKHDAFPIRGVRAQAEATNFKREDALLINPTETDPDEHLQFIVDDKGRVLATGKPTEHGPDPYGQASIQVFGLNRSILVSKRSELWVQLEVHGALVRQHIDASARETNPARKQERLDLAMVSYRAIEAMGDPKLRFSAVAVAYLRKLKKEFGL